MNAIAKSKRVCVTGALVCGAVLAALGTDVMAATECKGPLSGSFPDGIVVNGGDFCVLGGANVANGVRVNPGGILVACGSVISGGVESNGAAELIFGAEEINCDGDVVNGGVRISNTGPGILPPPGPSIALERSTIRGGVHVTGSQGMMAIAGNTISGGLFCSNNAFDPEDEGMENIVSGTVRCEFGESDE